jgi:hypothetical protein
VHIFYLKSYKTYLKASGTCTCNIEFSGTFCEDFIFCGSAVDLGSDITRDIHYEDSSISIYPEDTTLTTGWYYFGKDRFIPSFCPIVGKCLSLSPYWTNESKLTALLFEDKHKNVIKKLNPL